MECNQIIETQSSIEEMAADAEQITDDQDRADDNTNELLPSYARHSHRATTHINSSFAPEYTERVNRTYISSPYREDTLKSSNGSCLVNNQLIKCFFTAVDNGQEEIIKLVISEGVLTANTIHRAGSWNAKYDKNPELIGETPLVRAIRTRNIRVVKLLLELGAEVNTFSSTEESYSADERVIRTPLQLAASLGHLVIVKLLIELYHANDALIAPDGQIALRLAAENGHTEIVDYLPARRAGGFRRWKFKNRKTIRKVKHAGRRIYKFVKFFAWDVEKFFLWTIPKEMVGRKLYRGLKWCWENKSHFGPWLGKEISLVSGRLYALGRGLLKIPEVLRDVFTRIFVAVWEFVVRASKSVWRFATKTLPVFIKDFSIWLWKFLTISIPKVFVLTMKWIWAGIVSLAKGSWHIILKVVSFISTAFEAIISFFQRLTLADIWYGFLDILRSIFVSLPQTLWSWIKSFGELSYNVMKALFDFVGQILWWIGFVCVWIVTYIPQQIGVILLSIGGMLGRAGHEIRVFFDPKAR